MKPRTDVMKGFAGLIIFSIVSMGAFAHEKSASSVIAMNFDTTTVAKLEAASKKFQKTFDANDLKAVVGQLFRMKDVGLSYDSTYTTPTDRRVLKGKTVPQLRRLKAMYLVDSMYAIYFGKKADAFIERGLEIEELIGDPGSVSMKDMMNWNAGPTSDELKMTRLSAYWYDHLKTMPLNAECVESLSWGFYINAIETLHLAAKSGLASGVTEDYRVFLNGTLPILGIAEEMLGSFVEIAAGSKQQEFWKTLDIDADRKVVKELKAVVNKPDGMILESDLRKILSITSRVRDPLIAMAK